MECGGGGEDSGVRGRGGAEGMGIEGGVATALEVGGTEGGAVAGGGGRGGGVRSVGAGVCDTEGRSEEGGGEMEL